MCGILGFNWEDKLLLKRMASAIAHRGPDQKGFFIDKNISLGHQRLSIIDLSRAGKQPMHNEDFSIWITYNGEIYNFQEIKQELEKKGHKFYSKTDTEVIIHAYEEYGLNCLNYFNGMFAFCIYDSNKKELFLARDRLGIKPLYYYFKDGKFIFASEIKAILKLKEFQPKVDRQQLHNFLSFRYVPEPKTILQDIQKLPPGNYLLFKNNKVEIRKYWDLDMQPKPVKDESAAIKEYLKLLEESVNKMLVSDVPLGVYLSGGIDSSSIVSIMHKLNVNIKTFSIGYNIDSFQDELKIAKRVSEHYNTDHHEFVIDFNPEKLLPKIVYHMDEPIADPTALPTYLLSEMAKKYVTVVLVGDGADESLAGYEQYKFMILADKYIKSLPRIIKSTTAQITKIIPKQLLDVFFPYSSSLGAAGRNRLIDFITTYSDNYEESYMKINSIFTEKEKQELYQTSLKSEESYKILSPYFKNKKDITLLNSMLLADLKIFLPQLLLKVDKMTMAKSIESRVPFLDNKLVEFTAKLPTSLKMNGLTSKYILKKAMSNNLPAFVLRRKKQRFFVPIHYWLTEDLKDLINTILSKENIKERGYFNPQYIKKILDNYNNSKLYYGRQIWNLLTFEIWHRTFLEKDYTTDL